jgi:1-acyl-sn-glycerol-3-phosphate acyltransferase
MPERESRVDDRLDYGIYLRTAGNPTLSYRFFGWLARVVSHVFFRIEVIGRENIPSVRQPLLICSNHASFLDPPVIGCVFDTIYYLARKTLFDHPVMRWLLPRLNAIPIDQERPDLSGLRTTLRVVKSGHALLLFPEGSRTLDGHLGPAERGVGMMIAKTGAPVLPVRIEGSYEAWPRGGKLKCHPIRVTIGPLMKDLKFNPEAETAEEYLRLARAVMVEIAKL